MIKFVITYLHTLYIVHSNSRFTLFNTSRNFNRVSVKVFGRTFKNTCFRRNITGVHNHRAITRFRTRYFNRLTMTGCTNFTIVRHRDGKRRRMTQYQRRINHEHYQDTMRTHFRHTRTVTRVGFLVNRLLNLLIFTVPSLRTFSTKYSFLTMYTSVLRSQHTSDT